jgi:hypothetical protein
VHSDKGCVIVNNLMPKMLKKKQFATILANVRIVLAEKALQ